jgi:hypothetical protein
MEKAPVFAGAFFIETRLKLTSRQRQAVCPYRPGGHDDGYC